jgi:hypothetical protein
VIDPYAYDYPYDYGYPYYYSYPAYGTYTYSYPAQEIVVVRRPRHVVHAHGIHRVVVASPHWSEGVHARSGPV